MSEIKKYRLGNQNEEYELVTDYLGWLPENKTEWTDLLFPFCLNRGEKEAVIINPEKTEKITIVMHQQIIKDAFPMSFFSEERAYNWHNFYIVSIKDNPSKKFIIPLY